MSNSLKRKKEKKGAKNKDTLAKLRDKFINSGIKKFHRYQFKKRKTYGILKTNEEDTTSEVSKTSSQSADQIKSLPERKQRKAVTIDFIENRVTSAQASANKPVKGSYKSSESAFNFGIIVKSLSSSAPTEDVKLFIDTDFMDPVGDVIDDRVIWRRVRAINPKAEFFVEFTKFPVQILQSRIGTYALSSAVQLVMHKQTLFDNIVPKDQDFDKKYNGSFNFWFWKYGEWQNVVVDDFLPYEYNNVYEPVFSVLDYENSYWYSLLEKAYAKFYGSYHNLAFVTLEDALQDLTGGLVEYFTLDTGIQQDMLVKSYLQKSIIGLVVKELSVFKTLGQPLNCNEVYWLKDIISADSNLFVVLQKSFKVVTETFALIEGSDKDVTSLNLYVKSELINVEDNKVSISIEKIRQYFKACKIISFALTKTDKLKLLKTELKEKYWINMTRAGAWGVSNAGGNPQFSRTYWRNPQFRFKIGVTDSQSKLLYTIVLGLLTCSYPTISSYSIGFSLYEVKCEDDEIWNIDLNDSNCVLIGQHELEEKRQITKRFVIPPGLYAFIPYTSLPLIQGSFIFRLFYENSVFLYLWELNTLEGRTNQRVISTVQTYSQSFDFFQSIIKLGITVLVIGIIFCMLIFKI
ncbi:calpain-3-like [Cimex lectularius]|uniref:Calpain catalytic domain-containing protein n=1 Tax=Cimex lectularius TaxID=79782 RepID=A0A8I6SAP9_CIMLE|nr:calpain-3-like [Cimex lectularius]